MFAGGRAPSYSKTVGKDNDSDYCCHLLWPQMCWLHPTGKSHTGRICGASSISLWHVSYFTGEVIGVAGKTRSRLSCDVNPCTKFTLLCSSVQYKCRTLVTMNIGQIKFWDPPPLLQPCPCTQIVLFNQMKMGNDDVVYSNFLVVQPYIFVCKRLELLNVLRNFNSMVYINIQIM